MYHDRQKLRHASLNYGLGGFVIVAKFDSLAFNRSAPKTTFIAGPLAFIRLIFKPLRSSN